MISQVPNEIVDQIILLLVFRGWHASHILKTMGAMKKALVV